MVSLFVVAVEVRGTSLTLRTSSDSATLDTSRSGLFISSLSVVVEAAVVVEVEEVRTISLYSLTIPLRLIIFSELVRDPDDSDECSWLLGAVVVNVVDFARGNSLAAVVVDLVVVEVLPESEIKGLRILIFLILSLLSGRCGKSSSVLGVRGVVFPLE